MLIILKTVQIPNQTRQLVSPILSSMTKAPMR